MSLPFVDAKPDVAWSRSARLVRGSIDGVDITCESRWWGNQWNVTAESPFPVPEQMTLFVSARGMDHGFWRDLRVGDDAFDARFFVFCDAPALLGIVLGAATRRALSKSDGLVMYVRDRRVKTMGLHAAKDSASLDRHLAIHRALADDHRAFLDAWKERIVEAHGRGDATWPPTATLLRPSGALTVNLRWTSPTTRDAADWDDAGESMRTEVTGHDDRDRKEWSLREVRATAARTHVLAGKPFVLVGALPLALAVIDNHVERAAIASISVRDHRITVGLHGVASPRQLEGAVRIIQLIVDATTESSSPYR